MLVRLFRGTNYYKKHYYRAENSGLYLHNSPIHTAVFVITPVIHAIDFSGMTSFSSENFSLPVQPLKYDGLILKKMLKKMQPAGNVIWEICPFSFLLTDFSSPQKKTELFKCYQFLLSPDELGLEFNCEQVTRKCFLELKLFFRLFNRKELKYVSSLTTEDEYRINAHHQMPQWQQAFMTPPEYSETDCNISHKMISQANKQRQNVYCLLPPVCEEFLHEISPQRFEKYLYEPLNKAVSGYSVKVLDFMTDARFTRHEMFWNSLLLNKNEQKDLSNFIAA